METEFTSGRRTAAVNSYKQNKSNRKHCSIFEVPSNFFDSCRLMESLSTASFPELATTTTAEITVEGEAAKEKNVGCSEIWTCNTCKCSFESLHDQRSHFKSDFHRFNDIRELLAAWKPYFDASTCIFVHASSQNRQLLFDGENPYFSCQRNVIRCIPWTVRRPTFKEALRLYNILTQISTEPDEEIVPIIKEDSISTVGKENLRNNLDNGGISEDSFVKNLEITHESMPLHEVAKAGNVEKVLELLEQGLDPCSIDERGRTPYMLATEKEVRNTFRRFMALNLDKWDWQAAKVPSR